MSKAKAGAKKKSTGKKLAKSPEGLDLVWDKECSAIWTGLKPEHKVFFQEWLTNGYNGGEAACVAYDYNRDEQMPTAYTTANRILRNVEILKLRAKLSQSSEWEVQTARQVFIDAMSGGSHGERISGAKAHLEMIDKLTGTAGPAGNNNVVNNIQNNNIMVVTNQNLDSIRDLLNTPVLPGENKEQEK